MLLSVTMEELDEVEEVDEQEDRGEDDRFEYAELSEVISWFLSGSNWIDWALCLVEISIFRIWGFSREKGGQWQVFQGSCFFD